MLSLFNKFNSNQQKETDEVYQLLQKFYDSFLAICMAMKHLPLTSQQQKLMNELNLKTKRVSLSYVYTSPLNDAKQFMPF